VSREHVTHTPLFTTRVSDVQAADAPRDGGRWVVYCDHYDPQAGVWYNAGIIQDSSKRRLAAWIPAKRGAGFTEWCPECQEAHERYGAPSV
jgi:hypothetical protein